MRIARFQTNDGMLCYSRIVRTALLSRSVHGYDGGYGSEPRTLFFIITRTLADALLDSPCLIRDNAITIRDLCRRWVADCGLGHQDHQDVVPLVATKVFAPFSSLMLAGEWSHYAWPASRDVQSAKFLKLNLVLDFMGDWRHVQRQWRRQRGQAERAAEVAEGDGGVGLEEGLLDRASNVLDIVRQLASRVNDASVEEQRHWARDLHALQLCLDRVHESNMEKHGRHWLYNMGNVVQTLLLGCTVGHQRDLREVVINSLRVAVPAPLADEMLRAFTERSAKPYLQLLVGIVRKRHSHSCMSS